MKLLKSNISRKKMIKWQIKLFTLYLYLRINRSIRVINQWFQQFISRNNYYTIALSDTHRVVFTYVYLSSCWLFQARNRISVNGRNASGDSPGATNWRGITASTPGLSPLNARSASVPSPGAIISRCTWSGTSRSSTPSEESTRVWTEKERDLLFASRSFSTTCVGRALRGFRHSGFEARSRGGAETVSWRASRV